MTSLTKTQSEIQIMRESGKILAHVLEEVQKISTPGTTTFELDQLAEKIILEAGAIPSFKGYPGGPNSFPATLCISINDEAVHGIPSKTRILEEGDVLTIDGGVYHKGFHTDSATTFGIGKISNTANKFIEDVRVTLYEAIKLVKPGIKIGEISNFIEQKTKKDGYKVLKELIGHGIGRQLHESPQVPNFGKKNQGMTLVPGMTFCIEPIISESTSYIDSLDDNWTLVTRDGSLACQQEHTVLVTQTGFEILTLRNNEFFA